MTGRLQATLSLRVVVAGVWFAMSVGVVMSGLYIYTSRRSLHFDIQEFSWVVLFPAALAGLFGSVLGAGILGGSDPAPGLLAALRGAITTTACFVVCLVALVVESTMNSPQPDLMQFFWLLFLIMVYGGIWAFPVSLAIGAGLGLMLYRVRRLTLSATEG